MDEPGVRNLLNQVADTEPPPARVDLEMAIAAGRRGRRWRRVRTGASVLLAAGIAAAVVIALVVPAQGSAGRPAQQVTGGTVVPARFNPLVPSAAFGWLPPGFHLAAGTSGSMSRSGPQQLLLDAFSGNQIMQLFVYPTGVCRIARNQVCSAYDSSQPVLSRAPDVNGHRAYWLLTASLTWEYAPGAWAVLSWWYSGSPWPPAGSERAAVLRVAAAVRYGQTAPIRFPYWLSGLVAPWRVSNVLYILAAGRPVVRTLEVSDGPEASARTDYFNVEFTPAAHSDWSCPQDGQHVTVDGVAAVLENLGGGSRVCIPDWRGLRMSVMVAFVENSPPDPFGPHGVLALARKLHPIGPDPAQWTADLLR